jgi:Fanconi anemia group M protein
MEMNKIEDFKRAENLKRFSSRPKVIADNREKNSLVISELVELGVDVDIKHLILADYVISNEIAIERKTVNDFVSSMLNKRLVEQIRDLKNNYKFPLLIIEKEDNHSFYKPTGHPNLHENAIRGMMLTITTDFGVPTILVEDYKDTAEYILLLAKRQLKKKQEISLAVKRHAYSMKDQQQIIMESFPGIGPKTAKEILKKFKSIKNFSNASIEELKEIPKLGKKAEIIKKILEFSH